jgi:MoaA/NifB/PqqE/SkfB family radical SAM enzyme
MIVLWRVTTRCNLSCAFCAYDRRLPFARTTSDPASIRRFLDVLADYQQARQDAVLVSWLGGEPLLLPELPDLTTHATSRGLRISATTNGTTLGSLVVRSHLLDHYSELTISLDSPDERHDAIRVFPGLYHALRKNVSEISKTRRTGDHPLKLRVNTVLLRSTIERFPELACEIAAWGVDELTFNLLGGRDRPEYFSENRPLPAQFARFSEQLDDLRAEYAPHGLMITGSQSYVNRLASAVHDIPRPVADCGPGERFLFIDEMGSVSPCSFTSGTLAVPLEDLRNAADVISLSARFRHARCAFRPEVCDNCPSTQVFEKFSHHAA